MYSSFTHASTERALCRIKLPDLITRSDCKPFLLEYSRFVFLKLANALKLFINPAVKLPVLTFDEII
ncbi:hypothetical protein T06_1475 [Trichinella sp. T6]|nr:hypothetical protein T06_1475 [Trichinella sp. T6]